MVPQNQDRNGVGRDKHISRLVLNVWREILKSQAGSALAKVVGSEEMERLRSQFELYIQSAALTEFFGVEDVEFRRALNSHLQSQRIGAVFFIDILGARAWANPLFHAYCYEQIPMYVKRNFDGLWNLSIIDERIRQTIEKRLAKHVDIDDVMPDYGRGGMIDLQLIRILGWPDDDMKTDVAQDLIDLHRVFNIPLFHVTPTTLNVLFGRQNFEFHVAVDRQGQVPLHPEGCWVYYETRDERGEVIRKRVPYSQYEPKLTLDPLDHVWMILQSDECKFAFEKRRELLGQSGDRKRVLFVNTPTRDTGGFKGSPTSLLYAIGPLVEEVKAKPTERAIPIAGFSHLNIFDPTYYPDDVSGEFEGRLELVDPHIVGFSTTSDGVHIAKIMASQVKNYNSEAIVILGGPHCDEVDFSAKSNPNNPLNNNSPFDFVISGDGEYMLSHLTRVIIDAMREGKTDLDEIKKSVLQNRQSFEALDGTSHLYFNLNGTQPEIHCKGTLLALGRLPPLRYEYLKEGHFQDFNVFKRGNRIMKCVQVMTHRGCRGACSFCSEKVHCYPHRIKYNTKTVAEVIDEIWHYVRAFNIEAVFFDDSTFIEDEKFVKELCDGFRASGLSDRIKWGCLNRFDSVTDQRLIRDMVESGLVYMYMGLELFNDAALRRMIKFGDSKINMVELIERALDILKESKVKVGVSILFGLPAESEEVERQTIEWVGKRVDVGKIHEVSLSLLNYHLASALTSSSYRQDDLDYLNPTLTILTRQNQPPWNCFEEGGWFRCREREINDAYLARILVHTYEYIKNKKVLVRRNELEKFIASPWDRRAIEATEAHRIISGLSRVDLSVCRVVGKYVRADQTLCDELRTICRNIKSGLRVGQKSQCYLFCGPSGAGKTSIVDETAKDAGVEPQRLNLAGTTKEDFRSKLAELKDRDDPQLILVDEMQAKAEEEWPFEELTACMDAVKDKPAIFVFIGNLHNLSGMRTHIESRNMGTDLLRRILAGNEHEIPPLDPNERITVAISNIKEAGHKEGREINRVEKSALFFMALDTRLSSAGKLSDFVASTVENMDEGEDTFMYDHIFRAGEPERRTFWERHAQYMRDLAKKWVNVYD